ncbi:leucine-rich repeat-containing protein 15-like [Episyrphus balteatus]|uniref:leucine-rich repeat-containing protein 15-like n=1 Tax=Episyrphus balteatus TaxID=286459 RepID=UPI0024868472|nr:leucine-rich repeat-containing protein 15-like [Episyrphus balteatus]
MKSLLVTLLLVCLIGNVWSGPPSVPQAYMKCPKGCVCQYAHFMDLQISRWINFMQIKHQDRSIGSRGSSQETQEELVNENEVMFDGDEGFNDNPFIQQVTCILQVENDVSELVSQLPVDLQALVLLYTAEGKNKTVPTSVFKPLNQLTTLEIRGPSDRSFRLIIDEPMSFLHHANFESIALFGSENYKRPKNPVHPRESFDYVPSSEQIAYNISLETMPEGEDIDIVPYDVYIQEIKKSRLATFYGWEHLEVLRINHCRLDEMHWEMFDGLLELQHLSLEHNEIKIVPAFALYGAMHIKTLSLAYNSILDFNYRSLAGLLDLEVLDLSHNSLSKLSELSFPPFPKLEYVDFRHNPIRYIFPASFGVMNNTRTMHLGSKETAAELWGNVPFDSLHLLKILTITNVSIGALDHDVFQNLRSLEVLDLKGQIRSVEFDAFADMAHLRELNLSSCNIREISMDAFFGCKKLEIVDLSSNNLSYIPPGLFDEQNQIREIYLQKNNLKYLPSTFFHNPSLKLVRLTENPWKCTCDMALWKQKLTNSLGVGKSSRCIKQFHTGKQLSCRKIDNYRYEKALSPRCENYNGRSVYYVLRKDIQCTKTIKKQHHTPPPSSSSSVQRGNHQYQRMPKYKHLDDKMSHHDKSQMKRMQMQKERIVIPWAQAKANKVKKTMAHINSLNYLTGEGLRKNKSQEVENDKIFGGSVDEQFDFNYI